MASKLDEAIARVAVEASVRDPTRLIASASEAARLLKPADPARLPDRWAPKVSASGAGSPELRDGWHHLWFEALVEVLCQAGAAGVSPLLELLERDDSTYQDLVLPRLLRLCVADVQRDLILARLESRLQTMHYTVVYAAAREVVAWSEFDRRPLELLRTFAALPVRNSDGATVGAFIERMEWEAALLRSRRAEE